VFGKEFNVIKGWLMVIQNRILAPLIYWLSPRIYWERRHRIRSLSSVGESGKNEEYNLELYSRKIKALNSVLDKLKLSQGSKVLDVGCGIGLMQEVYVQRGHNVIGIDFSARAIQKAKELYPTFEFRRGTIWDVKEKDFNVINCLEVLMHILDDRKWKATIDRFKDRLKLGGYLILSDKMLIETSERDGYHIKNRGLKEYLKVLDGMEFLGLTPYPQHQYGIAVFLKKS